MGRDRGLAQRDADGSIRANLDRLGQLDDGVVNFIDQGQFMALRLEEAGIEATVDSYPGGHTTFDKVPELVDYLKEAAAINEEISPRTPAHMLAIGGRASHRLWAAYLFVGHL